MSNMLMQSQAEVKILEYKLDKIRKRLNDRIQIVDPIVKNELTVLLNMIEEYEHVPINWSLEKPLVKEINE